MKATKRIVSLLLCCLVIFSIVSISAQAWAPAPKYHVVLQTGKVKEYTSVPKVFCKSYKTIAGNQAKDGRTHYIYKEVFDSDMPGASPNLVGNPPIGDTIVAGAVYFTFLAIQDSAAKKLVKQLKK